MEAIFSLLIHLLAPVSASAQSGLGGHRDTPIDREGWRQVEEEIRSSRYKKYDPAFEEGKDIFLGKGARVRYDYCLPEGGLQSSQDNNINQLADTDQERKPGIDSGEDNTVIRVPALVELSRSTLAPFRFMEVGQFANQLYDCNDPGRKVLNKMERSEAGLVVYYLDRKYSLKLKQQQKGGGKKAKRFSSSH